MQIYRTGLARGVVYANEGLLVAGGEGQTGWGGALFFARTGPGRSPLPPVRPLPFGVFPPAPVSGSGGGAGGDQAPR